MRPSDALRAHLEEVRRVVSRHRAANLRVFGSAASGGDSSDSDLDLLVDPTTEMTLFDLGMIRAELQDLLGVPVEVVTPGALPERIRTAVLATARPL